MVKAETAASVLSEILSETFTCLRLNPLLRFYLISFLHSNAYYIIYFSYKLHLVFANLFLVICVPFLILYILEVTTTYSDIFKTCHVSHEHVCCICPCNPPYKQTKKKKKPTHSHIIIS